jgi:hypothetical protein
MTFLLCLVLISRLGQWQMSEIVTLSLNQELRIWCSRAHSVATHWRMTTLISNIFWRFAVHLPSMEWTRMWYDSIFSHCHYWGRRSNGSTEIGRFCQPRRNAPMHLLPSSFHWEKTMLSGIRSRAFNSSWTRPLSSNGNACRIISLCAHTMEWRSGSSSKDNIMGWFVQPRNTLMLLLEVHSLF